MAGVKVLHLSGYNTGSYYIKVTADSGAEVIREIHMPG